MAESNGHGPSIPHRHRRIGQPVDHLSTRSQTGIGRHNNNIRAIEANIRSEDDDITPLEYQCIARRVQKLHPALQERITILIDNSIPKFVQLPQERMHLSLLPATGPQRITVIIRIGSRLHRLKSSVDERYSLSKDQICCCILAKREIRSLIPESR